MTLDEIDEIRVRLLSSLIDFTKFFYALRYGREFIILPPTSRRSHYLIICNALEDVLKGITNRLIFEGPPRYGKTELLINFAAWSIAWNPSSNYIYTSYGKELAVKCTTAVRDFVLNPVYRYLFNVTLKDDAASKHYFMTNAGGEFFGVGAGGAITGSGAGIFGSTGFCGNIFVDDIIKPEDAASKVVREKVNEWYYNTLASRVNGPTTPIIVNNQRTNRDDLSGSLRKDESWRVVSMKALDEAGNALCPEKHTTAQLLKMKELSPYVFAAQYQQDPVPDGGAIFKAEWFQILDEEPEILLTFITVDTAETQQTYNDACAFSFLGIYKLHKINKYALHSIDCLEIRVEPKDLLKTFLEFYDGCMRHPVQPSASLIEKKSTGVTLISNLKDVQGIRVIEIERNNTSGNKAKRFIDCQPIVAEKRVSFTYGAKHTKKCIEHMCSLTPDNSQRFDDIGDTFADGMKAALIDNIFKNQLETNGKNKKIMQEVLAANRQNTNTRRRILRGTF